MNEHPTKIPAGGRLKNSLLYAWFLAQAFLYAGQLGFLVGSRRLVAKLRAIYAAFGRPRELKRGPGRLRRMYLRVTGRAIAQLFDYFERHSPDLGLLSHYVEKCANPGASAQLISSTAGIAISIGENDTALSLFSGLLRRHPEEASIHQQVGIRAFILGKYDLAEELWTRCNRLREELIAERGLDRAETRLLGPSWILAIGHIAHLDTYFKHKILGGRAENKTYLIPPLGLPIPNKKLLARWSGYIQIVSGRRDLPYSSTEVGLLQDEFWSLPLKDGRSKMFSHAGAIVQHEWEAAGFPPLLALTKEDFDTGGAALERLGVPPGSWFVCLHVREPGFHKKWHDLHPGTRNADISTYMPAAREIVSRGGYVIRMGDPSMKPLLPEPGIVDYAHSALRSEGMDIFLCGACKFFIGTNSGLGLVPPIFGVPCAMTNWSPIGLPQWYPKDLYIPKLLRSEKTGNVLMFEEMLMSEAGWIQFENELHEVGLRAIDNSPEELTELVLEMLARENGQEKLTEEDHRLRDAFNELVVRSGSYVGAQPGRGFLRRHRDLLQPAARQGDAAGLGKRIRYGT